MRQWRRSGAAVLVLTAGAGLAACGSDDAGSSGSGASASSKVAPEDLRASDADVAAGLAHIRDISTNVADAVEAGSGDAKQLEQIEPAWKPIEGTIKANSADAYITFEDNFAVLANAVEDKAAGKAKGAADSINSTADAYLAEYPG